MNKLDRLEALAERLIEGTFNWLFQTPLRQEMLADAPQAAALHWSLQLGDRRISLGEPVITIGRASDNDIVLSDPTVSHYHAQLRWRQGRYYLCPPGPSTNGGANGRAAAGDGGLKTAVDHQPAAPQPLAPGDVISLGNITLTVVFETAG